MKRESTLFRERFVRNTYLKYKQGFERDVFNSLSKGFIYEEVGKLTGMSSKSVARILGEKSPKSG